jgi:hypothetical protein
LEIAYATGTKELVFMCNPPETIFITAFAPPEVFISKGRMLRVGR